MTSQWVCISEGVLQAFLNNVALAENVHPQSSLILGHFWENKKYNVSEKIKQNTNRISPTTGEEGGVVLLWYEYISISHLQLMKKTSLRGPKGIKCWFKTEGNPGGDLVEPKQTIP